MSKLGKPVSQRQLRVGEMVKQALGMIFLREREREREREKEKILNFIDLCLLMISAPAACTFQIVFEMRDIKKVK